MCVIFIVDKTRPSNEMVEKAYDANNAGGGIAFRKDGLVHWKKGLSKEEMVAMCADVPAPFVAHFRIPTEGGRRQQLCHPFPIERNVPLDLEGSTDGFVLFHNGHWNAWRAEIHRTVKDFRAKFPSGKWSDTRGMALEAAYYGLGVLEMINEKAVAFGPKHMEIISGTTGWTLLDGIWCSNTHFQHRGQTQGNLGQRQTSRMCREAQCAKYTWDESGYCPDHRRVIVIEADDSEEDSTGQNSSPPKSTQAGGQTSTETTGNTEEGKVRTGALGGEPHQDPFLRQFDGIQKLTGKVVRRIPFAMTERLYRAGKISKKQFKKARRAWEAQQRHTHILH